MSLFSATEICLRQWQAINTQPHGNSFYNNYLGFHLGSWGLGRKRALKELCVPGCSLRKEQVLLNSFTFLVLLFPFQPFAPFLKLPMPCASYDSQLRHTLQEQPGILAGRLWTTRKYQLNLCLMGVIPAILEKAVFPRLRLCKKWVR